MSRNGSGTMSIPNTLVSGTVITASGLNTNFTDIKDEITNSVAVDGQSTMTGVLKAANGSAAAPAYTFGSDTDTGFYRISSDAIGIAAGGSSLGEFDTAGMYLGATKTIAAGTVRITPNPTTVSALPAASGVGGAMKIVTDATSTTFWSVAAGGGANTIRVTSDGTNWRIG